MTYKNSSRWPAIVTSVARTNAASVARLSVLVPTSVPGRGDQPLGESHGERVRELGPTPDTGVDDGLGDAGLGGDRLERRPVSVPRDHTFSRIEQELAIDDELSAGRTASTTASAVGRHRFASGVAI